MDDNITKILLKIIGILPRWTTILCVIVWCFHQNCKTIERVILRCFLKENNKKKDFEKTVIEKLNEIDKRLILIENNDKKQDEILLKKIRRKKDDNTNSK